MPVDDINIAEGVGLCRPCQKLHRLSDLVTPDESLCVEVVKAEPPKGTSLRDDGVTTTISASTRSASAAGFMWFFTIFWNSIVSVFVYIALSAVLVHIGVLPSSMLVPMSSNGGPSKPMDVGMTIFLCVFLIPFVVIGAGTFLVAMTSSFGKTQVILRGNDGVIRTGIGPITLKQRFNTATISSVRLGNSDISQNDKPLKAIMLIGPEKTIKFGTMLNEERRRWMGSMLRQLLVPEKPKPAIFGRE